MASGCNKNIDNRFNCPEQVSSHCVIYQGEAVPVFSICTGDTITETTEIILNQLIAHATGDGISLPSITGNCAYVTEILANKDKNISTLIQLLFDSQCTLQGYIDTINAQLPAPFAFDLGCLVTPANPSRDQILQAVVTKTCDIQNQVTQIVNDLATEDPNETTNTILTAVYNLVGNMLGTNINSCQNNIVKTGTGENTQLKFIGQNPIGTYLWGNYNLSSFDSTGLGLESAGMCGWALANGNNNTWDMRGLGPSGATNIPGPTLLPLVQANGDTSLTTNVGETRGQYKITLLPSQLPNHQHVVTQTPHSHSYQQFNTTSGTGTEFPLEGVGQKGSVKFTKGAVATELSQANITVEGIQGVSGQPHENRQPTRYGVWITRIS